METTELQYPVFETNQVLTSGHLNDLFEYLDEQSRLTRADLIGIGIVCGLEASLEAPDAVKLTRGCGVTSQGYLIVEPADVILRRARSYTLPNDVGYQPFMVPGTVPPEQYTLWELLDDEDDPSTVELSTLEFSRMAVVLLLELRRDQGRTCAPNDCDDRGSAVTTTVRRLLMDIDDVKAVIVAGREAGDVPPAVDVEKRLELPELRMPRYDVPNTAPVTAEAVLEGFQTALRRNGLAEATATALSSLYAVFAPIVREDFPTDPFTGFRGQVGFLDRVPESAAQVRGIQHYYDLFADLIAAYDEVRGAGVDLVCACCPPQGLFPRHLVAGALAQPGDSFEYRTRFIPSPAVSGCGGRSRDVRVLFRRLVAMIACFAEEPAASGIRVTPSRFAVPLSHKAIPYYYRQQGSPPLYQLWDPAKTAQGRPELSFSYRSDEYTPPVPEFVTDPLRFDLESTDFLRIEGHIGTHVGSALKSLLTQQQRSRLPIDVIALRTGTFDDRVDIDLTKERCRFQDIETLYETLRAELECFLSTHKEYFDGLLGGRVRQGAWASQAKKLIAAMSSLSEVLTDDLRELDLDAFDSRYREFAEIARETKDAVEQGEHDEPGLSGRLDDIVFGCRRDPFGALVEEYRRRVREAKREQFLGNFLERHPGIQHKGGVPVGGTFILVYHARPAVPPRRRLQDLVRRFASRTSLTEQLQAQHRSALTRLVARLHEVAGDDADIQAVADVLPQLLSSSSITLPEVDGVYATTVADLDDGTVIADFFVPYVCRSNCPPIHYQLPPAPLRPMTSQTCTNADGTSEVTVSAEGAVGALSVQVDGGAFEDAVDPLRLKFGEHTIVVRDDAGIMSAPVTVTIPTQLLIVTIERNVDQANGTYSVNFTVAGGTPPYVADPGSFDGAAYTSPAIGIAEPLSVTVTDAAGCTVTENFDSGVKPCSYPCDGEAVREAYRFWMPEPRPGAPWHEYSVEVNTFLVTDPDGVDHDLSNAAQQVLDKASSPIASADFQKLVKRWLTELETVIADELEHVGAVPGEHWLRLTYVPASEGVTTGTMYVERAACVRFVFDLAISFSQRDRQQAFAVRYESGLASHVDRLGGEQFDVPAFDRATANWCRGEHWVPECDGAALDLKIHRVDLQRFAVDVGNDDPALAFVWEIEDGRPTIAGGREVTVPDFVPREPTTKRIRVTAITERGCTVTVEAPFDIAVG